MDDHTGLQAWRRSLAATRRAYAHAGEHAAATLLAERGYTIIECNLRIGHDEADIVALAPSGAVVVVEVKARQGGWRGEDRVDATKRRNLLRLAAALAADPRFARRIFQFDVVAVDLSPDGAPRAAVHFEHAFDASGTHW